MKNKIKKLIGVLALAGSLARADAEEAKVNGSVAGYYDTRGMPNANLTLNITQLPFNSRFFCFTDFFMQKQDNSRFQNAYGEFKLTKDFGKGIGLALEYDRNFSSPEGVHRAGLSYSQGIKDGFLGITGYPFATKNDGAQIVLTGKKGFDNGKRYVAGFFDYNFRPNNVVTEIQLGKRIMKDTYFVLEGRHNGFMKKEPFGVGIGIERKF